MTAPPKVSITRRIRSLGRLTKSYGLSASHLVGTVLREWSKADFPALHNPALPFSKKLARKPEVVAFVDILRQLSFLEATYWLSSAYAMLSDKDHRKKLAMFFTPASLTKGLLDDLAEQGVNFVSQSFLDPACGGAAFLTPIALRIRDSLLSKGFKPRQLLKHIEKHLYGTDLDNNLCKLSKHFLCMALHDEIKQSGYVPSFHIYKANSLTKLTSKIGKVDVVVCNPPYRKMTAKELIPLRKKYSNVIDAQPNLYGLFIALCVNLLRINGYAALVTPTSFLSGQNFSRLRKFLLRKTDVAHIGMVSDRLGVFIDVEQETALTVLRRRSKNERAALEVKVSVVSGKGEYKNVGNCRPPNAGAAWPIPRAVEDVALLRVASSSVFRLTDYGYKVRIGAYVWNRDKRPKFKSSKEARLATPTKTTMPLLWSRDISASGTIRPQDIAVANGKPRFIDLGKKAHSSTITNPCVVLQRVTSNDQPRRLVAAVVSPKLLKKYGGFIGENHVVIVEQITDGTALPPRILAKILSAHLVDRYFRCISGATNVSAFELNQLALPNPQVLKAALKSKLPMNKALQHSFGLAF